MPTDVKITKLTFDQTRRDEPEFLRAFDLISTTVHEQLVGLDALLVANALCSVAANVLYEAGMTHADVAKLLETLAHLSRLAESECKPVGNA